MRLFDNLYELYKKVEQEIVFVYSLLEKIESNFIKSAINVYICVSFKMSEKLI